jgi:hypothetical protein
MPRPPSEINQAVPFELEQIINKALEKDRTLRYQHASEMRADLSRLRRESKPVRLMSQKPSLPWGLRLPLKRVILVVVAMIVILDCQAAAAPNRECMRPKPRLQRRCHALLNAIPYVVSTFLRQAIKQIGIGCTLCATVQSCVKACVDGVKTRSGFGHRLLSAFGHRSCVAR